MKMKSLKDGSVFLLPLRDSGYATGVLARKNDKGICFGYFFGPRIMTPDEVNIESLHPDGAFLVGKFGDFDLRKNNWVVIGEIPSWTKQSWPIAPLVRVDELSQKAWLSLYDDNLRCIHEKEIPISDMPNYHYDRTMGSGSVEMRLTSLLS